MTEPPAIIVPPPARLCRSQAAPLQTVNEPAIMTAEMYQEYVTYHTNVAAQTAANTANTAANRPKQV